ncbi:hypothetical protein GCM10027028_65250 [Streptomyces sundarbansensis]
MTMDDPSAPVPSPVTLRPAAPRPGAMGGSGPLLLWADHYGVRLIGSAPIGDAVIGLGLILLIIGLTARIGALWTIGIILVAIGAEFWALGGSRTTRRKGAGTRSLPGELGRVWGHRRSLRVSAVAGVSS